MWRERAFDRVQRAIPSLLRGGQGGVAVTRLLSLPEQGKFFRFHKISRLQSIEIYSARQS
jgi:hypothetical protein